VGHIGSGSSTARARINWTSADIVLWSAVAIAASLARRAGSIRIVNVVFALGLCIVCVVLRSRTSYSTQGGYKCQTLLSIARLPIT
jgi:hypothetical protein